MFNRDLVRRWLAILHGDSQGLIHICATGLWTGRTFAVDALDAATDYTAELDATGREGIYLRATTINRHLEPGERGGGDDTLSLPGLWADIDLAGPGHSPPAPLPPDETTGRAIIATSGLPEPTLWVHSGGGLYPWWLLEEPHTVGADLGDITQLASHWQTVIGHAATRLGWHYGTGVKDLARVLRIPGTINRKAGLARPCRILSATTTRYSLERLYEAMAVAMAAIPDPEPAAAPRLVSIRTDGGLSPGDDFAERADWGDILQPAGWTYAYSRGATRYWRRPGKTTPGISATTNATGTDRLKVFSTDAGIDTDGTHTKLFIHAELHHGGDLKAAAKALKNDGYGRPAPLSPDPAAQQRAAIADLIPPPTSTTPPRPSPTVLSAVDGTAARVIAEPLPTPAAFGPTEDGLARALVAHHGHELRYCPQRGSWLTWNGHVWNWDDGETHREMIRALARNLPDGDGWITFKKRGLSAAGVTGVARLAQSDAQVVAPFAALDSNAWELNTPNGIVDLRNGIMRPADPAALHTRSTTCSPDASADTTMWQMFLSQTFGNNVELVGYLRRLVGYSAVGQVGPHVLPFAFGSGGNGKGVFLEAVAGVLGAYATTAPVGFLMAQMHAGHETEIARLAGARMVICSEVNEDDRFDEAKVKQLTGGDTLTARFMRQDHFSFTPTHQLWLMGNHKPAVRSGGRSFWRRLRLLPFEHEVPEDKVIDDLQGLLVHDHGPALLAWIVGGAAEYAAAGGLREPERVKAATNQYEHDQDTVARFLDDRCLIGGGEHVTIKMAKLREAYERWCHTESETAISPTAFGLALKRKSIETGRTTRTRFYIGVSLLSDEDEAPRLTDDGL